VNLGKDKQQNIRQEAEAEAGVWFVFDGQCPICTLAANAINMRANCGPLYLLDARKADDHVLIAEIAQAELDLDEGMVVKYGGGLYHGADALVMISILGSGRGWFNRMNGILFKNRRIARISYPVLKAGRNLMLKLLGIQKINS
jgi:predicted DCC family thiol-disulfide oxidoreductase YuxK